MPPRQGSRHLRSIATDDDAGRIFLGPRDPYEFRDLTDNVVWHVKDGDSLQSIAATVYASLSRLPTWSAANLWWVIADFQPRRIIDPTIKLVSGSTLVCPSPRVVQEEILSRRRR